MSSPTPSSHTLCNNKQQTLNRSTMTFQFNLSPLPDLSLSVAYLLILLSKYQDPTSFPKVLPSKSPLEFILLLCAPTWYFHAGIYLISQLPVYVSYVRTRDIFQLDNILLWRISVWPQFISVAKLHPACCARPETAMTSEKNFKLTYQEKCFWKINQAKPQVHEVVDR